MRLSSLGLTIETIEAFRSVKGPSLDELKDWKTGPTATTSAILPAEAAISHYY